MVQYIFCVLLSGIPLALRTVRFLRSVVGPFGQLVSYEWTSRVIRDRLVARCHVLVINTTIVPDVVVRHLDSRYIHIAVYVERIFVFGLPPPISD